MNISINIKSTVRTICDVNRETVVCLPRQKLLISFYSAPHTQSRKKIIYPTEYVFQVSFFFTSVIVSTTRTPCQVLKIVFMGRGISSSRKQK